MAMNTDFTNGNYSVYFDKDEPQILLAIGNAFAKIPSITERIEEHLKYIGTIRSNAQETSIFPFDIKLFEKDDAVVTEKIRELEKSLNANEKFMEFLKAFDLDYKNGLEQIKGNYIVDANVHLIQYDEKKDITEKMLTACELSKAKPGIPEMIYNNQFYALLGDKKLGKLENEVEKRFGSGNGWACRLEGTPDDYVSYHRFMNSVGKDCSYENGVGKLTCSLGILTDAKAIKILGIEDTIKMYMK